MNLSLCPTWYLIILEGGNLTHSGSGGSREQNTLWLLDPVIKTPGLNFSAVINLDDEPQVMRADDPMNKNAIFSWSVHKDGRNGDVIRIPYALGLFMRPCQAKL
jgi:hypothetical protein